jgi:hypothetical protein
MSDETLAGLAAHLEGLGVPHGSSRRMPGIASSSVAI